MPIPVFPILIIVSLPRFLLLTVCRAPNVKTEGASISYLLCMGFKILWYPHPRTWDHEDICFYTKTFLMLTRVYKKVSPCTLPHTFEPEPMHLYTFLHAPPPVPSNHNQCIFHLDIGHAHPTWQYVPLILYVIMWQSCK